jgi:rhodanese-related sulfurtransferase
MKKLLAMLAIGVMAAVLALPVMAQAPAAPSFPPIVMEKVKEARQGIKTTDMAGFRKVVDNPGKALIVDVREPNEYAAGHVPGAINVPRGVIEFQIWKHVGFPDKTDLAKEMYLYCATGGRCSFAAKSLKELGFTNVTAVPMMLAEWAKAGHPLVK